MITFGSKADTLRALEPVLTTARVLPQLCLRTGGLEPEGLLSLVREAGWQNRPLIVRSSARNEDTAESSNAGKFLSIAHVQGETAILQAVEQVAAAMGDDPENQVFYGLMESLYQYNPARVSIAGTVESIAEITADTLYDCHAAFYNPGNMTLCVCGNVDPEQVCAIAREILPREGLQDIPRDYGGEEAQEVCQPEKVREMAVSTPIFQLGWKADPAPMGEAHMRQQFLGELACEAVFGTSTPLYARLYREGLVNQNFSYGYEAYPGCALLAVGGESRDPWAVREAIAAEAARIGAEGLDEALFTRLKKGLYGGKVRALNSFEFICVSLAQGHFAGEELFRFPEVFEAIAKADVEEAVRRWMTPDRTALSVVKPKGEPA